MNDISDLIEKWAYEREISLERLQGDASDQSRIASMTPLLIEQMRTMDLTDAPSYKHMKLLPLGTIPGSGAIIGGVTCSRAAYLGPDGKLYIEGPRKYPSGKIVIDIHLFGVGDTKGWGGVRLGDFAELMTTYFI